jgi:hypothetical protein
VLHKGAALRPVYLPFHHPHEIHLWLEYGPLMIHLLQCILIGGIVTISFRLFAIVCGSSLSVCSVDGQSWTFSLIPSDGRRTINFHQLPSTAINFHQLPSTSKFKIMSESGNLVCPQHQGAAQRDLPQLEAWGQSEKGGILEPQVVGALVWIEVTWCTLMD